MPVSVRLPTGIWDEDFALTVLMCAGGESSVHLAREAPLDLLRELLQVEGVDEAMNRDECMRQLRFGVDSLGL